MFQVIPAILLIYSISRVKTLIKRLNSAAISVREWLMSLHTGVFAFYILISLAVSVLAHVAYAMQANHDKDHRVRECRFICAANSMAMVQVLTNSVTLILFTFMSSKFS